MTRRRRTNRFQSLRVLLDCGHEEVIYTSMYRLHKARLACLLGSENRRGVRCGTCGGLHLIRKLVGQESYE